MRFSHLVQINDLKNPLIRPLARSQVWNGLVRRAEDPIPFVFGLDECRILGRQGDSLRRELRFGEVVVVDRVTFEPPDEIRYDTEPGADLPGGSLVMRIEEPSAGGLYVRFEYETLAPDGSETADFENAFRKSAYIESDIDTIRKIRQLVEQGIL